MMKKWWNLTFYVICTNQNVKERLTQKWRLRELLFSKQVAMNKINEYGQTCVKYSLKIKLCLSCKNFMHVVGI
jgi:hypothetical protein